MQSLEGWIPARVYWREGRPMVDWCWLGELRLTDPFFEQTINQALALPANLLFRHQTGMEVLEELAANRPGLAPTGFIFHMSRCGSTLLTQMLAALPRNVVLSEPGPLDSILRAHFRNGAISEEQRISWLRSMVGALGQRRSPGQKHLFIKFDCWHTPFLGLIQRAFPNVPWLFLYRHPLEVMMSQQDQRGAQMIPGVLEPALFGWDDSSRATPLEEYGARVLAAICEAALDQLRSGTGKLVNYGQLPEIVWSQLLEFWGVSCPGGELEQMRRACGFNAKNPVLPFEPDAARKHQRATAELRELAERRLEPVYQRLESERLRRGFA